MRRLTSRQGLYLISGLFVANICVSMYISHARQASWSERELRLVDSYSYTRMRLWTIDDREDSLLLRRRSLPLSRNDVRSRTYRKLRAQLLATVTDPDNPGVGIAAPQVGVERRLVAVQRFDKPGEPFEFYVNPELVWLSEQKQTGSEGCLSIPGLRGEVERSSRVVVEYRDERSFEVRRDTVEGFTAVIFQHETDHLDGVLYIDRARSLSSDR